MEAPENWEEVLESAVAHGQALLERNAELQGAAAALQDQVEDRAPGRHLPPAAADRGWVAGLCGGSATRATLS